MSSRTDAQAATYSSRRTVVRGAAWSVPVVAVAAAAPAYAASCGLRSARVSTTTTANSTPGFSRTSEQAATWRSADPDTGSDYLHATVTIGATKTSGDILFGFQTASQNLTTGTYSGVAGVTMNQRPASGTASRGAANKTVTTYAFDRTVYGLQFTLADISNSGTAATKAANGTITNGSIGFWDAVYVETSAGNVFTSVNQAQITGTGLASDPFTPRRIYDNNDNSAQWNTAVTIPDTTGVKWIRIHYYSMSLSELQAKFKNDPNGISYSANYTDARGGQGVTISNLSMILAPNGC